MGRKRKNIGSLSEPEDAALDAETPVGAERPRAPPPRSVEPDASGLDGCQALQSHFLPEMEQVPAEPNPLTSEEVEAFIRDGFIMLRNAFTAAAAGRARDALWERVSRDGISPTDPATWTRRHGIAESYTAETEPWGEVLSPRLRGAVDQLCGAGRTGRFGCGWWVVTFPGIAEEPWGVDGSWHVDGFGYRHYVDSREIGLLPIFLFNDLGPHDGGTLLMPGSHRDVARLLWETDGGGVDGGRLSRLARAGVNEGAAVEVNGRAGDVCLVHPFTLHARSKNMGRRPGCESVRFMCHPAVPLREPMNVRGDASTAADRSPVEAAVASARPAGPAAKGAAEYANEETGDRELRGRSAPPSDLELAMGFEGFGKKKPRRRDVARGT